MIDRIPCLEGADCDRRFTGQQKFVLLRDKLDNGNAVFFLSPIYQLFS